LTPIVLRKNDWLNTTIFLLGFVTSTQSIAILNEQLTMNKWRVRARKMPLSLCTKVMQLCIIFVQKCSIKTPARSAIQYNRSYCLILVGQPRGLPHRGYIIYYAFTNNQQQITNNKRQTTNNQQPTTNSISPFTKENNSESIY